MKLDLTNLFDRIGEKQKFSQSLDLSDAVRWGKKLFIGPVEVSGMAENRSGIVYIAYTADFTLDLVCDRCLTALTRTKKMEFTHILVLSLNCENNDEFIVIPDGRLDLAELVSSDILLGLPTSVVCDNSCKGLCQVCGKNLNDGECDCDRTVKDMRFDKLRDLLGN